MIVFFVIFSSTALRSVQSLHHIKRPSERAMRRKSFACLNTVITGKIASCAVRMFHEDFSRRVLMLQASVGSSCGPSISMYSVRVVSDMITSQRPI